MLIFFKFSFLLGGMVSSLLGIFIYLKNGKQVVNKTYAGLSLCSAIWSFGFFVMLSSKTVEAAYFWRMFMDAGAIFIPAFWMHFIYSITDSNSKKSKEIIAYYIFGVFLLVSNFADYVFPGIFIKEMVAKNVFNYYPTAGFGYYLFLLFYITVIPYSLYYLAVSYFKSSGLVAQQIKYLIIAAFVGFVGGGMTFLLTFNIPVVPYGVIFFAFYPIIVAFAITKHHLFDIKVITTELFTFTLWVVLLIKIFFSNGSQDLLVNIIIFLLVAIFGILLIRGAIKGAEFNKKLLEESQKNLDIEQRLRKTFAEIAEEQTREIEKIISGKKS
ncbi:MAG: histidine kinase N-terminal 7TM domain-containing protein [Candidatus Staskawiczbacteria bacterium]|nr:histidine kinase N-terminal 7TM domain-containing protein [Candidatus Staskawiczbacteria bacterium]